MYRIRMRRFCLFSALIAMSIMTLCGFPSEVWALDPETPPSHFVWDRWSGDDLPARSLRSVVVGPQGYVWTPSYGGLIRFDGQGFEVFNPPLGFGVTTNGFTVASLGSEGEIWLGGTGGGVFTFVDGDFDCVLEPEESRINTIAAISDDGRGGLWVGGSSGLVRIGMVGQERTLQWIEPLAEYEIAGLAVDRDGMVWAASNAGLFRVSSHGEVVAHPELEGSNIEAIAVNGIGELWAWESDRGLVKISDSGVSVEHARHLDQPTDVKTIYFDRDDGLWVGGVDSVYRLVVDRFEQWPDPTGGGALSFTEDREGNLWFCSYYEGLTRLAEGKFSVFSTDDGLASEMVHSLAEDNDGAIWVGTDQGLSLIRDDRVDEIPPELKRLGDEVVLSVEIDSEGVLWIGTYGDGLHRWDGRSLERLGPGRRVEAFRVRRLLSDGDSLWVGSYNGLFELRDGVFRGWSRADGLRNDFILALERLSTGELLLGSDGGGLHLLAGETLTSLTTDDGLASMFVMDVFEDRNGSVWLATAGGISRYADGEFSNADSTDGLVGRAFLQILEDDHGFLWMTSESGISRVAKNQMEAVMNGRTEKVDAVHFDHADGLLAVKMTGTANALKAEDGRLWFSTMNGVAVVDPGAIVFNDLPPPVAVEEVSVDGRRLVVLNGRFVVPAGFHSLEITSSGLSFAAPEKVLFRYRLVGFSEEWQEMGTRRTAYFTSLKPKDYRFEVTACNNDGLWNNNPSVLTFTVQPRFYQTALFFVGCGLLIFLLGIGAAMIRVLTLTRKERKLAALVDERTRELAEANHELARLARIDGLTEIANFRRFREFIDEEWRRCLRLAQPLSVVMIDTDHFKRFNDRYGHCEGDQALRRVASIVQDAARRPGDLAARYGGEEFVVVLTNTSSEGAARLAELIRSEVAAARVVHEESEFGFLTVSAGVGTVVPDPSTEYDNLITQADNALYRAKAGGRNRVVIAG